MGNEDEEFPWKPIVTQEEKEMIIEASEAVNRDTSYIDGGNGYFKQMAHVWDNFIKLNKRFREDKQYAEYCEERSPALLAIADEASRDFAIRQYVDINHEIEGKYY